MFNFFSKTIVINRDTDTERLVDFSKEMEFANITNFLRFPAIIPKEVNYARWEVVSACRMSHLSVIQYAKDNGLESILVFEDDAIFEKNFHVYVEKVYDFIQNNIWDMFYLGLNHVKPPIPVKDNINKVVTGYTTHAYAMHSRYYDYILEKILNEKEKEKAIDVIFSENHEKNNVFSVNPRIVYQRPSYSSIEQSFVSYDHIRG